MARDVEQAIAQIADIRAHLAASKRFRGYAPESVALVGVLSLAVTIAQLAWPDRFATDDPQIVRIWGLVLAAGFLGVAMEAVFRTLRENDGTASPGLISALRVVIPGTVMIVTLGIAILNYAPQTSWIIPGTWQMLIGLIAFGSYAQMPRRIFWPGAWFVLAGAGGLFLAGSRGSLAPLIVGVPFIVGHLGIAWTLFEPEPPIRD